MSIGPTSARFKPQRDYLWWAVAVSALLHALAAWWWAGASSTSVPSPTVDVALVNFKTESAPLQAHLLAQWQADGGGTEAQAVASSPTATTELPSPDQLVLMALQKRQRDLEAQQQQLLSQLESSWEMRAEASISDPHLDTSSNDDADHTDQRPTPPQSLHTLRATVQRYNQSPRYIFEGPSAQQSPVASYIETWRARIEALGTELYPEQARGQRSGTVQLTVYIRYDGSLERVVIHRPADDPIFTLTAQRVVNLAAPYAPFSLELAEQGDIIAITRTWHFHQQTLSTEIP